MTSRAKDVKPNKKDRPRSTDRLKKKGGQIPDAPPSEPQDLDLDTQRAKPAIINDEILALQIKPEDLEKLREPHPPAEAREAPPLQPIAVRKLKPASEWNKPRPKPIYIAKPAPLDAPLKDVDYSGSAGPRYDDFGDIVPHSILGSVVDYKQMAQLEGTDPIDESSTGVPKHEQLTLKYEKKKKFPKFQSCEENNALKNWQIKMRDRKRQQNNLSKLLNKAPDKLVMNHSDNYRKTQELRYIVDRTIHAHDYGKGYRTGSEFWRQLEPIGDDLTGLQMSLNQTDKGYPPPIEHVSVPQNVLAEKGTYWDRPSSTCSKPWHRNPFLEERLRTLHKTMKELDPHAPTFEEARNLEIIGDAERYKKIDVWRADDKSILSADVSGLEPETDREETDRDFFNDEDDDLGPVSGPSLKFAGQPARWQFDSNVTCIFTGQVALEARVPFEEYAGKRVTSFLDIVNDGTTAIFYDWKKIPKTNPFDIVQEKVQRFYFNTGNGVVLPGETMKFPFVFKSPNPGVFQEQWEFETRPTLCGGAALIVTLRGVSLQEDKYKKQRNEIEEELRRRQTIQIVTDILNDLVDGVREQERPKTAIDKYITDEEIFRRLNPSLTYHNERIKELQNLYRSTFPEEERNDVEWDFDVTTLMDTIMEIDEDDDDKQDLLERLNKAVAYMSFPQHNTVYQQMYNVTYGALCEMVDSLVSNSMYLSAMLGMPEKESDLPDESRGGKYPASAKSGLSLDRDKKTPSQKSKPDLKGGKPVAKDGAKPTTAKSTKDSMKNMKSASRPLSTKDIETVGDDEIVQQGDPVLEAKYKDKLYAQGYLIVEERIDRMAYLMGQIQETIITPELSLI